MTYHPVSEKIVSLLEKHNISFKRYEHEPVRTSEEAAAIRPEYTIKQGSKALIVRVKKSGGEKSFAMIVVPGDARFDVKKVRKILEAQDIRFATEEEVADITNGVQPGGVPPFGNLFNLPILADNGIFDHEEMIFNAGDRAVSIAMKTADYKNLIAPIIDAIV